MGTEQSICANLSKICCEETPENQINTDGDTTSHHIDEYTNQMIKKKIKEIKTFLASKVKYPLLTNPPPYYSKQHLNKTCLLSVCSQTDQREEKFQIPLIDEYFGNLLNIHKYDKMNALPIHSPNQFKTNENSQNTDKCIQWVMKNFKSLFIKNQPFAQGFDETLIYSAIKEANAKYNVSISNTQDTITFNTSVNKRYYKLSYDTSVSLKGDKDNIVRFIAFVGFGKSRTKYEASNDGKGGIYMNDTTFLSAYDVRNGYHKYGAIACFDPMEGSVFRIYTAYNQTWYQYDTASKYMWQHAKWVWKTSITVAVFFIDIILVRLNTMNRFIKLMRNTLDINHPMRRFLIPFTFGTVYANLVYNEYCKENGLFHRIFAFKYDQLSKLVKDTIDGNLNLTSITWPAMVKFMSEYMNLYWETEDELVNDKGLMAFMDKFTKSNAQMYTKMNKNQIVLLFTSFIYIASVYNDNVIKCASFEYSISPEFIGLKIVMGRKMMIKNTMQTHAEYCLFVLCTGYKYMEFDGNNCRLNKQYADLLIFGFMRSLQIKSNQLFLPQLIVDTVNMYFDNMDRDKCLWDKILLNDQYEETKKLYDCYYPLINNFYSPYPSSSSIML